MIANPDPEDNSSKSVIFFRPQRDLEEWDETKAKTKQKRDMRLADPEVTKKLVLDGTVHLTPQILSAQRIQPNSMTSSHGGSAEGIDLYPTHPQRFRGGVLWATQKVKSSCCHQEIGPQGQQGKIPP